MSNGARSIPCDGVRRPSADRGCRRARHDPRRFDRDCAHTRGCGESLETRPSSSPGGNRPRVSAANSFRRSRGLIPTHSRSDRTPGPSCLLASPRPEAGSTNLSQGGFSTSPILRSVKGAPSDRSQCCCRWPFSLLAWSKPSPTIACPAGSDSRVLLTCQATGPSSSRRSACKRCDRGAFLIGVSAGVASALRSTAG
jgi:hypothetical protein